MNQIWIALCSIMFSGIVSANTNIQTLKLFDGQVVYCNTPLDVYHGAIGAYRVKASSLSMTADNKIKIKTKVNFLTCSNTADGFGFIPIFAYKETNQEVIIANGDTVIVEFTPLNVRLVAFKEFFTNDSFEIVVFSDKVMDNKQNLESEIIIDPFQLLTPNEQIALKSGEVINLEFLVTILKMIQIKSGDMNYKRENGFGNFRIRFSIEQNNAELSAKLLL